MDPLTAFRQYTIDNHLDRITRAGDEYRFGDDFVFPAKVQTAYRSKSKSGHLYTLESLIHFVTHRDLPHNIYFSQAQSLGGVTFMDRKDLLDYLTGVIPNSDSIDPSAKIVFPALRDLNAVPAGEIEESPVEVIDPMEWIRSSERPLKDRTQLLLCKNRDFYGVLTEVERRELERRSADSLQRKDNLVAKSRIERGGDELGFDGNQKAKQLHLKGVPIILVPSASSTLITIYNVKEFLEDGVFIPTSVKMAQMKVKPDCVTVQKKFSRDVTVTAYEVRDKPTSLKAEDWDRVVAVFVLGKEWQFKDWPYKDHVEIFNKVMGFYLRFEDDSVESAKTAKQWNVKIISISKNKRHQDRAAALEVWDRLEEFMRSRTR